MKKFALKLFAGLISLMAMELEAVPLLDDRADLELYVASFPLHLYGVYEVPGQGKFYIDNINDLIKNHLRSGNVWEPHIVNLLKEYVRPGSVVVDIGAHIGTHTLTMARRLGSSGVVWAFEPQKKIYRELIANCILNKVENRVMAVRYALGDVNSVIEMHPTVAGNEAGTPIGVGGDLVEMRTLDSFDLKNVSLIKLDAEGSENRVIDGATQTILKNKPIIIIEICGGWPLETAPPEVRAMIYHTQGKLNALGYDVYHLGSHDYLAVPRGK